MAPSPSTSCSPGAASIRPSPWSTARPDASPEQPLERAPAGAIPRVFLFGPGLVESTRAEIGAAAADVRLSRVRRSRAHRAVRLRRGSSEHQSVAHHSPARETGPALCAPHHVGPLRLDADATPLPGARVALVGGWPHADVHVAHRYPLAR